MIYRAKDRLKFIEGLQKEVREFMHSRALTLAHMSQETSICFRTLKAFVYGDALDCMIMRDMTLVKLQSFLDKNKKK